MGKFVQYNPSFQGKWLEMDINFDDTSIEFDLEEVSAWCDECLVSRWSVNESWRSSRFYFKNNNDAAFFKLTWL